MRRHPAGLEPVRRTLAGRTLDRPVGRRDFLRAAGLAGLAVGAPGLLSSCGVPAATQTPESCPSHDLSPSQKELIVSNWPLYIDEDRVKRGGRKVTVYPTMDAFEKKFGIKVDYTSD